jgi:plasmid stabilization system protein ParE
MRRYILAPEAALDLVEIWRYLKKKANVEIAERVEGAIRDKVVFLASTPGAGHWRRDLTDEPVNSYLIVYRAETKPLQVVAILHGSRDVESVLSKRF